MYNIEVLACDNVGMTSAILESCLYMHSIFYQLLYMQPHILHILRIVVNLDCIMEFSKTDLNAY